MILIQNDRERTLFQQVPEDGQLLASRERATGCDRQNRNVPISPPRVVFYHRSLSNMDGLATMNGSSSVDLVPQLSGVNVAVCFCLPHKRGVWDVLLVDAALC